MEFLRMVSIYQDWVCDIKVAGIRGACKTAKPAAGGRARPVRDVILVECGLSHTRRPVSDGISFQNFHIASPT